MSFPIRDDDPMVRVSGTYARYLPRYKRLSELTSEEKKEYLKKKSKKSPDGSLERAVFNALRRYFSDD